jgi:hypothetical protein
MKIKTLPYQLFILICFISLHNTYGQTTRYVKPVSSGLANGSSWANASSNLQAMLNISTPGDAVWVSSGTYYPTSDILKNQTPTDERDKTFSLTEGVQLYGGFSGSETSLSQRVWSSNPTVLSGDLGLVGDTSDNAYHVVFSIGVSNATLLDGFTIRDGFANGAGGVPVGQFVVLKYDGAGLYNAGSSPTITNVAICNNTAFNNGGGVYNDYSSPLITNCVLSGNTGIYNGGGMYNISSSPILTNCTLYGNVAGLNYGKAMYNISSSPLIKNSILWGNTGGGLYQIYDPIIDWAVVTYSTLENGYPGTGNSNIDPNFVNAALPAGADNQWMTADDGLALQANSTAINGCDVNTSLPAKDITGYTRSGVFDMGAYEFRTPLSIKEVDFMKSNHLKIYPNPAQDQVLIDSKSIGKLNVEVFDINGKEVLKQSLISGTTTLDIHPLAPGIYLFKVISTEGSCTSKLIKQ